MSEPITWGAYFTYKIGVALASGAAAATYAAYALWLKPAIDRRARRRWEMLD